MSGESPRSLFYHQNYGQISTCLILLSIFPDSNNHHVQETSRGSVLEILLAFSLAGKFAGEKWGSLDTLGPTVPEWPFAFGSATEMIGVALKQMEFWPSTGADAAASRMGFRFGDKGTHTSRTMMLSELTAVLAATAPIARRDDYAMAIIDANCAAKPTGSTRRLTNQRLGELYALDPGVPIFRILRNLWTLDELGRPLLALLTALARDPLLRATAPALLALAPGGELQRDPIREALRVAVGERLNEATLGKVVRNASSSWTQSGHLVGRTHKSRQLVKATPASLAFCLYLGYSVGFRGEDLLASGWVGVLDCTLASARDLALDAKRQGLIDLRIAGDVWDLRLERLDPWTRN